MVGICTLRRSGGLNALGILAWMEGAGVSGAVSIRFGDQ